MDETRKSLYYLEKTGNASAFEHAVARVRGVTYVHVDSENNTIEYEIDEWSSDYDVLTEVMRIATECGASIDFDRTEREEQAAIEAEKAEEQVNMLPAEQEETEEQESVIGEAKKEKKPISENLVRVIELFIALVAYGIALFTEGTLQFVMLAIAFAIAGYDALYEAFVKITKKQFISEQLLITIAFVGAIFLGYATYAVAAVLLYSVVAFGRKIISEKLSNGVVSWENPEKLNVENENGIFSTAYENIEEGMTVSFAAGERITVDGKVKESSLVSALWGAQREIGQGDHVYAGEVALQDITVTVLKTGTDCKYANYNAFAKESEKESTPILKFINEHNQIYHLAVLVVCLLIAFIPPIFNDYGYVDGLYDWGYKACIIATVTGFGYYLFSSEVNVIAALKAGKKTGAVLGGLSSAEKIANSNGVYLDFEGVLLDENGNLKQDSLGAMREMRDNKVTNLNLVCSCGDEKAEEICKNLKIGSYYNRTEEQKADVYSEALNNGGLLVVSSKNSVQGEKGAVVVFNAQQEGFCKNGSVMHGEIAYLPYIIKLAKRTAAINKVNLILGVTVKVALIALALLGIAQMWWAVLADSVVSIITAVLAFVNSSEIY